jgi:ABC-type uncharacterized transport system permease subunit
MESTLLIASTACFLIACVVSWSTLRQQRRAPAWLRIGLIAVGFVMQSGFLYLRGQELGRCPMTSGYEILIFVSWAMALIYFVVGPAFHLSLLGFFTAPLIALFQIVAIFLQHPVKMARPSVPDYWVELHASLALISYGSFALAFVAGVMFLIQDRYLRSGRLGDQLPPLHYLTQAIGRLLWLGFLLLTIGILAALKMDRMPEIHKLVAISLVWFAYGIVIVMKLARGVGARRLATAAIAAFAFPIVSYWFI